MRLSSFLSLDPAQQYSKLRQSSKQYKTLRAGKKKLVNKDARGLNMLEGNFKNPAGFYKAYVQEISQT